MFKRVLVPLDGTPEAAAVLPMAETLARARAAELVLVRVSADYAPESPGLIEADEYLTCFVAGLAAKGYQVRQAVLYGDVAEQIVAAASNFDADLILMATHGRGGLARAWLGSVTEGVLAHSTVPVMLLRPTVTVGGKLGTLLVPIDGSPGSAMALAAAQEIAVVTGARVVLVQVVPPLPRWGRGWEIDANWEKTVQQGAQQFLEMLARGLIAHGVPAVVRTVLGPVGASLRAVAAEVGADLIVMSTHALTGPKRALLGSVADDLVRTADQPILLVKQGIAFPTEETDTLADGEHALEEARPDQMPVSVA